MNKSLKINTDFDVYTYLLLVKYISDGYFENGDYIPHIGRLNTMRIFYNYCVKDKNDKEVEEISETEVFTNDKTFLRKFEESLECKDEVSFDFANAYREAMLIVDSKIGSFGNLLDKVGSWVNSIADSLSTSLNPETVEAARNIANEIKAGTLSPDAIAKAYEKTTRFKEVIKG